MRDAEPAEFPSTTYPRLDPRHAYIWIRVGGRWREAHVHKWVHERSRDRWLIWAFYDDGKPQSVPAWFVYDEKTVKQRRAGDPPPSG